MIAAQSVRLLLVGILSYVAIPAPFHSHYQVLLLGLQAPFDQTTHNPDTRCGIYDPSQSCQIGTRLSGSTRGRLARIVSCPYPPPSLCLLALDKVFKGLFTFDTKKQQLSLLCVDIVVAFSGPFAINVSKRLNQESIMSLSLER